jgi:hypothetical protein
MDIAGPMFEEQVSPPPWLAVRWKFDVRRAVEKMLEQRPDLNADEIVAKLAEAGTSANGALVAQQVLKRGQLQRRDRRAPGIRIPDPRATAPRAVGTA